MCYESKNWSAELHQMGKKNVLEEKPLQIMEGDKYQADKWALILISWWNGFNRRLNLNVLQT